MKPSKKMFLPLSAVAVGSVMFALGAGDHDGHDHSGHSDDHGSEKVDATELSMDTAIVVADERQSELGIETAEVPMRPLGENADEATALPKGSVFREDGKFYVLALSDGTSDSFEKWKVTLGVSDDFFVEAKTGVFPGDRIVVAGVDSIRRLSSDESAGGKELFVANSTVENVSDVESTRFSEDCPSTRRGACEGEKRVRSTKRTPRCRTGMRDCEVIVIEEYPAPRFHGRFDRLPHRYGYRGW